MSEQSVLSAEKLTKTYSDGQQTITVLEGLDLEVGAGLLERPRLLLRVDRRVDAGVRLTGMVRWRLSVASAVVNPCVLRDVDVEQNTYKFK